MAYSHKRLMLSSTSGTPGWSLLPRNNSQLSKDTSGQSQQPKDVGFPLCLIPAQQHIQEPTIITRLGTCPRVRMAILPQVRDPSISTSVQKSVIPLNILPALNYLCLQLLITASEWFGLMDLCQCTANLNLNPCKLFASPFFFRKRSHRTTTCHAKPHLFVVSLFACLFQIYCLKTLLMKCRKNI